MAEVKDTTAPTEPVEDENVVAEDPQFHGSPKWGMNLSKGPFSLVEALESSDEDHENNQSDGGEFQLTLETPGQRHSQGRRLSLTSITSSISVGKKGFEKIDSDMIDAVELLHQLGSEEKELIKQARKAQSEANSEMLEALLIELEWRQRERERLLSVMSTGEEERRQNIDKLLEEKKVLRNQNQRFDELLQRRKKRMEGEWSSTGEYAQTGLYDWVVDVTLLGDVSRGGWKVCFNDEFYERLDARARSMLLTEAKGKSEAHTFGWEGAVVAVVGLYDKGKTFVLNEITQSNLPSGKKVSTKGLSFKHVNVDSGTRFIILDSAGSYSPVKVVNELSVVEKEATELFLLDLVFELSDYFICVVNDFTSLDQRFLDKLSRNLQNSTKEFREVIVVHNLKEITSYEVLQHLWETQVTQIYGSGSINKTKVAAVNPNTNMLEEKHVEWFKTKYTRHICLANCDSEVGEALNPWAFSLLRYWLKAVFVPVDRKFSVVDSVIHYSNAKLSQYFKSPMKLVLFDGDDPYTKYIKSEIPTSEPVRLPQVSIDASGLMLTRPDSFMPQVDIIKDETYMIYLDIPGLSRNDVMLSRQNVMTIVKGKRIMPYDEKMETTERAERKYGDFTMTFRIPEQYERRWSSVTVENGVMCIKFRQDQDEGDGVKEDVMLG